MADNRQQNNPQNTTQKVQPNIIQEGNKLIIQDVAKLNEQQVKDLIGLFQALLWTPEKRAKMAQEMSQKWTPEKRAEMSRVMKAAFNK